MLFCFLQIKNNKKKYIYLGRSLQSNYLHFYLRTSESFQTIKVETWYAICKTLSIYTFNIAKLNSFLCCKWSWAGAKGFRLSNHETFKDQTLHIQLIKLLHGAQINIVSKTEVMIIGVLKKVYSNIHSAKHQSTWFTSSAYIL